MKKLIIRSFGNSDLYLDGKNLSDLIRENKISNEKKTTYLEYTKEISEKYNEYKDKIEFPMIKKFFNGNNVDISKSDTIDFLGIFSRQNPEYQTDTYYLHKIFSNYSNNFNQIKYLNKFPIILEDCVRIEPIEKKLREGFRNQIFNEYDRIYVSITGGTKGMVGGLLLSSISTLDLSKLELYYGEEVNGRTAFINQTDVLISIHEKSLKVLLNSENYEGVIRYIEDNNLKESKKELYGKSLFLYNRLGANYDECEKIYSNYQLGREYYISADNMEKIEEMINGIIYTRRTGRYVEFLGRLYNFTDVLLIKLISDKYDLGSISSGLTYKKLRDIANEDKGLESYLNKQTVGKNNAPLDWDYNSNGRNGFTNTVINKYILDYLIQNDKSLKIYSEYIDKFDNVNKYRNETMIGHGTNSVNKEKILELYSLDPTNDTIEDDFRKMFNKLLLKNDLRIDMLK